MAEVVLFHHIQGLTEGVRSFADELRQAGHAVHTPDLFDGHTFATMKEAFSFVQDAGDALDAKADSAAHALPEELVYGGISWGVGPAQRLAQTRAGARGALLYEACFPISGEYAFAPWPNHLPVQIHGKADDEFFAHEGDLDAARELVATIGPDRAELFVYPGAEHLFLDPSLPTYDADAAALVTQRTLHFLSVLLPAFDCRRTAPAQEDGSASGTGSGSCGVNAGAASATRRLFGGADARLDGTPPSCG